MALYQGSNGMYWLQWVCTDRRINAKKKETILKNLSVLIPANIPIRLFYSTLPENETTIDLVNGRDASEEQ